VKIPTTHGSRGRDSTGLLSQLPHSRRLWKATRPAYADPSGARSVEATNAECTDILVRGRIEPEEGRPGPR